MRKPKRRRFPEDPALEAEARRLGEQRAVEAFGPDGFCRQIVRTGEREFMCHICHQPGAAGDLVSKTVWVKVG